MAVRRDGNQSGSRRKPKPRPVAQPRPRTGPAPRTPRVEPITAPTPYVRPPVRSQPGPVTRTDEAKQRRHERSQGSGDAYSQQRRQGGLDREGRNRRPGGRYGPGRQGPQRILPLGEAPGRKDRVISSKLYEELLSQGTRAVRERSAFNRANPQFADDRLERNSAPEVKVAGLLGTADVGRFLEENVTGRQTIFGGAARGLGKLAEPSAHDAIDIAAQAIPSAYATGRALVKAAPVPGVKDSDTRELESLWDQFKETDPVALAVQGRWGEAGKQAGQHPLATLLEVAGPIKGGSMAAGRVARPRREVVPVEGTRAGVVRSEPQGLIGRGVRRGVDRVQGGRSERLAARADELEQRGGDAEQVRSLRRHAKQIAPGRVTDQEINHVVDVTAEGLHQSIRRPHRGQAAQEAREALGFRGAGRRQPKGGAALSLRAQTIAKADRGDLEGYLRELDAEHARLREFDPAKAKANRRLRHQVAGVLRGDVDMADVERAARSYAEVANRLERGLVGAGMLDAGEAKRSKLIAYAARAIGVRKVEGVGIVRRGDEEPARRAVGELRRAQAAVRATPSDAVARSRLLKAREDAQSYLLTDREIEAHARERGVDLESAAYVPQGPARGTGRAFNVPGRKAQGIPTKSRTGAAVAEGTLDASPERMVEQVVKAQGLLDADRSWKRFVTELGYRKDDKLVTTTDRGRADRIASSLYEETGREWQVIRLSPWGGRDAQLQRVLDEADAEGFTGKQEHPVSEAMEAALRGQGGEGPFAIVPRAAAARLAEHAGVARSQGVVMRGVTQAFRQTVLPLSPTWLTGNVLEGVTRAAVARAGPRSWITYRRVLNEIAVGDPSLRRALVPQPGAPLRRDRLKLPDPAQGSIAEQLMHMTPGGHYGGTADTMIHTSAKQLEGGALEPLGRAIEKIATKPVARNVASGYRRYTDWVFSTMNAGVEAQFTRALAGKYIRRELMSKESRRTVERAVEQAAKGMRNTPEQVGMADFVRRAYGQYDSMPPWARRNVLLYTPFGAWAFNALKFIFNVLPKDHPMVTAALAANHQLQDDWRKEHGLDHFATGALPPFLQGSIPLPGGAHLRISRYTPFGLMGDPLESVAGTVLPQLSGALMAARGLDWKGDQIRNGQGEPERDPTVLAAIAAREFGLAVIPAVGMGANTLRERGGNLDPFRVVEPKDGGAKDPVDEALEAADGELDTAIDDALDSVDEELEGALP